LFHYILELFLEFWNGTKCNGLSKQPLQFGFNFECSGIDQVLLKNEFEFGSSKNAAKHR
jgi:hypothetical protein